MRILAERVLTHGKNTEKKYLIYVKKNSTIQHIVERTHIMDAFTDC